eukprot:scaffold11043_cov46-Phaeocystis_antarctica.AAC.2
MGLKRDVAATLHRRPNPNPNPSPNPNPNPNPIPNPSPNPNAPQAAQLRRVGRGLVAPALGSQGQQRARAGAGRYSTTDLLLTAHYSLLSSATAQPQPNPNPNPNPDPNPNPNPNPDSNPNPNPTQLIIDGHSPDEKDSKLYQEYTGLHWASIRGHKEVAMVRVGGQGPAGEWRQPEGDRPAPHLAPHRVPSGPHLAPHRVPSGPHLAPHRVPSGPHLAPHRMPYPNPRPNSNPDPNPNPKQVVDLRGQTARQLAEKSKADKAYIQLLDRYKNGIPKPRPVAAVLEEAPEVVVEPQ